MEQEPPAIKTTELNDAAPTTPKQPRSCIIAWSAIGLLLATWLGLFLAFAFFWKKNNDLHINSKTELTQIQGQLSQNQKNLIQVQSVIQKNFTSNNNLVRLNEIKELIQLANYNLFYLHDPNNALSALSLANKQLTELGNLPSSVETLRNSLTQNINQLNTLPHLDLGNTLAQLNNLKTQVTALPLLDTTPETKEIINPPAQITSQNKWINAIQTSLHNFQQLIVVRHLDKPIEPLLPEIQQQYLQQNLQLLLQQAQWALLHHQQTIYQSSLQQTKQVIQQYFAEKSSATQSIFQKINELEKINLQEELPNLNPSLSAINSLIKTVANISTGQKETPL
jgi:uroporphyrin-3 C-methyltransferase